MSVFKVVDYVQQRCISPCSNHVQKTKLPLRTGRCYYYYYYSFCCHHHYGVKIMYCYGE